MKFAPVVALCAPLLTLAASPAWAQDVHPGDVTIAGDLQIGGTITQTVGLGTNYFTASNGHSFSGTVCVGVFCTNSETFTNDEDLKIKATTPWLKFEDASTAVGSPTRDWMLITGLPTDLEAFALKDLGTNNHIVVVEAGYLSSTAS